MQFYHQQIFIFTSFRLICENLEPDRTSLSLSGVKKLKKQTCLAALLGHQGSEFDLFSCKTVVGALPGS